MHNVIAFISIKIYLDLFIITDVIGMITPDFYLAIRNLGLRFHASLNGTVAIEKIDLMTKELEYEDELLNKIAISSQFPYIFNRTLEKNITLRIKELNPDKLLEIYKLTKIDELKNKLEDGYQTPIVEGEAVAVSGGETQKISLARALAKNSQLIILDEPSSALDSKSEELFTSLMNGYLKVMLGFIKYEKGSIRMGDKDYNNLQMEDIRKVFTYIDQNPYTFNTTIKENLLIANTDATTCEITEVLKKIQITDFIKELPEGLNTSIGQYGYNLSGGEIKRLIIARALLKKSEIILLDEPIASLDINIEKKL